MLRKVTTILGAAATSVAWGGVAEAQTITTRVFETVVPFSYNRGRNESVTERLRPEYAPQGVPAGAFTVFPTARVSGGYEDNVYQTETDRVGDGFLLVSPAIQAISNWSVHRFSVDARGSFKRYLEETPRNETGWSLGADGRIDATPDHALSLGARTSRLYESQFSGAALNNVRSSVPVQTTSFRGSLDSRFNRVRTVLAGDYSVFDYKPVRTLADSRRSQDDRDRNIVRGIGHVEYGLTPDAGVFLQLVGVGTDYRTPLLTGQPNRDSTEVRVLGGVSLDISALMRGSIGVGYTDRRYDAGIYNDVAGLTFNGRVEYFMTQLTTVTLAARREIEDSLIGNSSGYFNNGVTLRVDHELLRNLLLNVGADYEIDDFRGIDGEATVLRVAGGGEYYLNQTFGLSTTLSYARRTSDNNLNGPDLREFRAMAGIVFRR